MRAAIDSQGYVVFRRQLLGPRPVMGSAAWLGAVGSGFSAGFALSFQGPGGRKARGRSGVHPQRADYLAGLGRTGDQLAQLIVEQREPGGHRRRSLTVWGDPVSRRAVKPCPMPRASCVSRCIGSAIALAASLAMRPTVANFWLRGELSAGRFEPGEQRRKLGVASLELGRSSGDFRFKLQVELRAGAQAIDQGAAQVFIDDRKLLHGAIAAMLCGIGRCHCP